MHVARPGQGPEQRQEDGEAAEPDETELPEPRRTRYVEHERLQVAEIEQALARAGLADAGLATILGGGHVDHAKAGHADQQLEQDLEAHRPELDAVEQDPAAEEEPGERIG